MLLFLALIFSIIFINPFSIDPMDIKVVPFFPVIGFLILFSVFKKKSIIFPRTASFFILSLLSLIELAQYFFMTELQFKSISWFFSIHIIHFALFFFLLTSLYTQSSVKKIIKWSERVMPFMGLLASIVGLVQFWHPEAIGIALVGNRPGSVLGNPNSLGLFLVICSAHIFESIYKSKMNNSGKLKSGSALKYNVFLVILFFLVILLSKSLNAWGLYFILVVRYAYLSYAYFFYSRKLTSAIIVFFLVCSSLLFILMPKIAPGSSVFIKSKKVNLAERFLIMKSGLTAGLNAATVNPLYGMGPHLLYTGLTKNLSNKYYSLRKNSSKFIPHHSHCELIKIFAERGFIVALLYVLWVCFLLYGLIQIIKCPNIDKGDKRESQNEKIDAAFLFLILLILILNSFFSVNLSHVDINGLFIFYSALAMLMYSQFREKQIAVIELKGPLAILIYFIMALFLMYACKPVYNTITGNSMLYDLESIRGGQGPQNLGRPFFEKYKRASDKSLSNLMARKRLISFMLFSRLAATPKETFKRLEHFMAVAPDFGDVRNIAGMLFYKNGQFKDAGDNFFIHAQSRPFLLKNYSNSLYSYIESMKKETHSQKEKNRVEKSIKKIKSIIDFNQKSFESTGKI